MNERMAKRLSIILDFSIKGMGNIPAAKAAISGLGLAAKESEKSQIAVLSRYQNIFNQMKGFQKGLTGLASAQGVLNREMQFTSPWGVITKQAARAQTATIGAVRDIVTQGQKVGLVFTGWRKEWNKDPFAGKRPQKVLDWYGINKSQLRQVETYNQGLKNVLYSYNNMTAAAPRLQQNLATIGGAYYTKGIQLSTTGPSAADITKHTGFAQTTTPVGIGLPLRPTRSTATSEAKDLAEYKKLEDKTALAITARGKAKKDAYFVDQTGAALTPRIVADNNVIALSEVNKTKAIKDATIARKQQLMTVGATPITAPAATPKKGGKIDIAPNLKPLSDAEVDRMVAASAGKIKKGKLGAGISIVPKAEVIPQSKMDELVGKAIPSKISKKKIQTPVIPVIQSDPVAQSKIDQITDKAIPGKASKKKTIIAQTEVAVKVDPVPQNKTDALVATAIPSKTSKKKGIAAQAELNTKIDPVTQSKVDVLALAATPGKSSKKKNVEAGINVVPKADPTAQKKLDEVTERSVAGKTSKKVKTEIKTEAVVKPDPTVPEKINTLTQAGIKTTPVKPISVIVPIKAFPKIDMSKVAPLAAAEVATATKSLKIGAGISSSAYLLTDVKNTDTLTAAEVKLSAAKKATTASAVAMGAAVKGETASLEAESLTAIQKAAILKALTAIQKSTAMMAVQFAAAVKAENVELAKAIVTANAHIVASGRQAKANAAKAASHTAAAGATVKHTVAQRGFNTAVNQSHGALGWFIKGVNNIRGSTSGLQHVIGAIRNQLLLFVFAFGGAIYAMKAWFEESRKTSAALSGLGAVAANSGNNMLLATEAAKNLAATGLYTVSEAAAGLKNLLSTGLSLPKAIELMKALTNSAAFNRQGQLSMGEAIVGATEGIKNQNSIMVDNAGITKNLSIMYKEYAASIGTSVGALTDAQKSQATYEGVIRESQIFKGNAALVLNTTAGAMILLEASSRKMAITLGNLFEPAIRLFINSARNTSEAIAAWAQRNRDILRGDFLVWIKSVQLAINMLTKVLKYLVVVIGETVSALGGFRTIGFLMSFLAANKVVGLLAGGLLGIARAARAVAAAVTAAAGFNLFNVIFDAVFKKATLIRKAFIALGVQWKATMGLFKLYSTATAAGASTTARFGLAIGGASRMLATLALGLRAVLTTLGPLAIAFGIFWVLDELFDNAKASQYASDYNEALKDIGLTLDQVTSRLERYRKEIRSANIDITASVGPLRDVYIKQYKDVTNAYLGMIDKQKDLKDLQIKLLTVTTAEDLERWKELRDNRKEIFEQSAGDLDTALGKMQASMDDYNSSLASALALGEELFKTYSGENVYGKMLENIISYREKLAKLKENPTFYLPMPTLDSKGLEAEKLKIQDAQDILGKPFEKTVAVHTELSVKVDPVPQSKMDALVDVAVPDKTSKTQFVITQTEIVNKVDPVPQWSLDALISEAIPGKTSKKKFIVAGVELDTKVNPVPQWTVDTLIDEAIPGKVSKKKFIVVPAEVALRTDFVSQSKVDTLVARAVPNKTLEKQFIVTQAEIVTKIDPVPQWSIDALVSSALPDKTSKKQFVIVQTELLPKVDPVPQWSLDALIAKALPNKTSEKNFIVAQTEVLPKIDPVPQRSLDALIAKALPDKTSKSNFIVTQGEIVTKVNPVPQWTVDALVDEAIPGKTSKKQFIVAPTEIVLKTDFVSQSKVDTLVAQAIPNKTSEKQFIITQAEVVTKVDPVPQWTIDALIKEALPDKTSKKNFIVTQVGIVTKVDPVPQWTVDTLIADVIPGKTSRKQFIVAQAGIDLRTDFVSQSKIDQIADKAIPDKTSKKQFIVAQTGIITKTTPVPQWSLNALIEGAIPGKTSKSKFIVAQTEIELKADPVPQLKVDQIADKTIPDKTSKKKVITVQAVVDQKAAQAAITEVMTIGQVYRLAAEKAYQIQQNKLIREANKVIVDIERKMVRDRVEGMEESVYKRIRLLQLQHQADRDATKELINNAKIQRDMMKINLALMVANTEMELRKMRIAYSKTAGDMREGFSKIGTLDLGDIDKFFPKRAWRIGEEDIKIQGLRDSYNELSGTLKKLFDNVSNGQRISKIQTIELGIQTTNFTNNRLAVEGLLKKYNMSTNVLEEVGLAVGDLTGKIKALSGGLESETEIQKALDEAKVISAQVDGLLGKTISAYTVQQDLANESLKRASEQQLTAAQRANQLQKALMGLQIFDMNTRAIKGYDSGLSDLTKTYIDFEDKIQIQSRALAQAQMDMMAGVLGVEGYAGSLGDLKKAVLETKGALDNLFTERQLAMIGQFKDMTMETVNSMNDLMLSRVGKVSLSTIFLGENFKAENLKIDAEMVKRIDIISSRQNQIASMYDESKQKELDKAGKDAAKKLAIEKKYTDLSLELTTSAEQAKTAVVNAASLQRIDIAEKEAKAWVDSIATMMGGFQEFGAAIYESGAGLARTQEKMVNEQKEQAVAGKITQEQLAENLRRIDAKIRKDREKIWAGMAANMIRNMSRAAGEALIQAGIQIAIGSLTRSAEAAALSSWYAMMGNIALANPATMALGATFMGQSLATALVGGGSAGIGVGAGLAVAGIGTQMLGGYAAAAMEGANQGGEFTGVEQSAVGATEAERRTGGTIKAENLDIFIQPVVYINGQQIFIGSGAVSEFVSEVQDLLTDTVQSAIDRGEIDLTNVSRRFQ